MKAHTKQFIEKRRFLMALPLLVMPFVVMIFWALGGGKGIAAPVEQTSSGLNMHIPFAHFDKNDDKWDKFSLYEQAKRDSIKYEEAKRNDPYYVVSTLKVNSPESSIDMSALNTSLGGKKKYSQIEQDEQLINERLELLTNEINRPQQGHPGMRAKESTETIVQPSSPAPDIDRLEKMMELMARSDSGNPEMDQMQDVLNKILDVQHPERVADKIRQQSIKNRTQIFPVQTAEKQNDISTIESAFEPKSDTSAFVVSAVEYGFYSLDDQDVALGQAASAIEAVIHDTQTVVTGSTIRMRLTSDVMINGQLIERDQFVYGTCAISGDRLTVTISTIQHNSSLLPVALSVYDLDGIAGVSIPGAITRDAAKQATSQSIQDIELYSMSNSIGVQAATAGVEAAKGLFSKKAKVVKATVKAGHQILLKDNNQKFI